MTEIRKKSDLILLLKRILYIYYLIYFKKNQAKVLILLDLRSEMNFITSIYIAKPGFKVQ